MRKVILIHANCLNKTARGDFSFAGNIAKDLACEIKGQGLDIDVILVSTADGTPRFEQLYGTPINGKIWIEGMQIGLYSLESFDAVENSVIAFIDANRCKHAPGSLVKSTLAPESKLLFIGNLNRSDTSPQHMQLIYRQLLQTEQPNTYNAFHENDFLIGNAGIDSNRYGLPIIKRASELLGVPQGGGAAAAAANTISATDSYGFVYLAPSQTLIDNLTIAQYMLLSNQDRYVLVGNPNFDLNQIKNFYIGLQNIGIHTNQKLSKMECHSSLPYIQMRKMVAGAGCDLVVSTGIFSTLEAMQDGKLPYYQYLDLNEEFVKSYLATVRSVASQHYSSSGSTQAYITLLSTLLFEQKPLGPSKFQDIHTLLSNSAIRSALINTNKHIIQTASGKLAPRLLNFILDKHYTTDRMQIDTVCSSLRKNNELITPTRDQALRRAAAWGRLFEMKVLIKSMPSDELNTQDAKLKRTALHWAVDGKHIDCMRLLIKAGAFLNPQDNEGKTPLHKAAPHNIQHIVELLLTAGAALDIPDQHGKLACEYTNDDGIASLIRPRPFAA